MRLKLSLFFSSWLLVCLIACSSNNSSSPQPNSTQTVTQTQSNQTSVTQPAAANTDTTGGSPQPMRQQATATGIDACALIQNKEVAKVQGGAIKEAKSNQRNDGQYLMSQCFYTAEEFVRSVSLTVFQPNPADPSKQPKEYFAEKFRDAGKKSKEERENEREREKEKERKEKSKEQAPESRGEEEEEEGGEAEPINGLGDQAFWVKTGPTASLYVLKKNQFLILSLGGGDAEPVKLRKTKELAKQALKRLN